MILDRDGVLNRRPPRGQYVRDVGEFEWLPGSLEALRAFHEAGYRVIVASNQAGVARGHLTVETLEAIHDAHAGAGRGGWRIHRRDLLLSPRLGCRVRVPQAEARAAVSGAAGFLTGPDPNVVPWRRRARPTGGGGGRRRPACLVTAGQPLLVHARHLLTCAITR